MGPTWKDGTPIEMQEFLGLLRSGYCHPADQHWVEQAADTIERLTKERDAARAEVEQQRKQIGGLEYHLDAARGEVGRLKAETPCFFGG